MTLSDSKKQKEKGSSFQRGINCGKAQERQTIISKLDAIRTKSSWDFQSEIYELIEALRKETYWPHRAKGSSSIATHYQLIKELRKETK